MRVPRALAALAGLCAVLAGVCLAALAVFTCLVVVGRQTDTWVLVGDFELTAVASGAAVALFLPWCQLQHGHILVDFFTARAGARTRRGLDRAGALVMAGVMGLLAWRTVLGSLAAWQTQAGTMILGFPEWLVHATMAPPMALAALIALAQATGVAPLGPKEAAP